METLHLKLNYGKNLVPLQSIRYIESAGNYSQINLQNNRSYFTSFTLKIYSSELLKRPNFFIPKRGLLINLNFLDALSETDGVLYAIFKNGEEMQLSRRKGKALIEHLKTNRMFIKRVYY